MNRKRITNISQTYHKHITNTSHPHFLSKSTEDAPSDCAPRYSHSPFSYIQPSHLQPSHIRPRHLHPRHPSPSPSSISHINQTPLFSKAMLQPISIQQIAFLYRYQSIHVFIYVFFNISFINIHPAKLSPTNNPHWHLYSQFPCFFYTPAEEYSIVDLPHNKHPHNKPPRHP